MFDGEHTTEKDTMEVHVLCADIGEILLAHGELKKKLF